MFTKALHSKQDKQSSLHPAFGRQNGGSDTFVPAIQLKLEVGAADSAQEREADRIADRVTGGAHESPHQPFIASSAVQPASEPRVAPGEFRDADELANELLPPIQGEDGSVESEEEPERNPPEEEPEVSTPEPPDESVEQPSQPDVSETSADTPETDEEEKGEAPTEESAAPDITAEESQAFTGEPSLVPVAPVEVTPELSQQFIQPKLLEADDQQAVEEQTGEDSVQKKSSSAAGALPDEDDELLQASSDSPAPVSTAVESGIQSSLSRGKPMDAPVRNFMEGSFDRDFSSVRIHTDETSADLNNKLRARAFTYKNHIFFNSDQYRPGESKGDHLIAHELTHVVQQGEAVSRKVVVNNSSAPQVQRLGISDALDYFADAAYNIPGYRMFTIILGVNPINMSSVDRSAANILRAMVEFLPGGKLITDALDNHSIFDKASSWFKQQIDSLSITGSSIKRAIDTFLDSLSWSDIFDLADVWRRAKRIFTTPIKRLISFAKGLVSTIMEMVKEAILRPLATLAEGTAAYDLLRVVLGEDPITGDPYPPTAENLIGGFMTLIGQEEVWNNIREGNAIERAFAWFQGAMQGLMSFVTSIPTTIIDTITSLTWQDIVLVAGAFEKVGRAFINVAGRFMEWAGGTVLSLLEILFSVVAPGAVPWIQKAGSAFNTILENPIGFLGNLVLAAKNGFLQFSRNILSHLKNALINWLTGSLAGAGIHIPQSLSIQEILKFVLSVLGVTWANIREKLVKHLGEPAVKALETGFELVTILVTKGPMAMWERIKEQLADLKTMVIGEITSWVVTKVVTKAITKLVTSLNPAGAVIQAILMIYDTITFLIDKISQIAQVGMAVLNSMAAIASGSIGAAVQKVEQVLAGMLNLAISFLAEFLGLGKISDKVLGIVRKVQAKVDAAIDAAIGWIVGKAKAFLKKLVTAGVPEDPQERLRLGLEKAVGAVNALSGKGIPERLITPVLAAIKTRYDLVYLKAKAVGKTWVIEGKANPVDDAKTNKEVSSSEAQLIAIAEVILEETSTSRVIIPAEPEKHKVRLVANDVSLNKKIVADLINKSSIAMASKRSKIQVAHGYIDRAGQSDSEAQIYYLLRQAQKVVNDIYGAQAASLPPNLETHHVDRVAENPSTFEKTKKNRIRRKVKRKITSLPQSEQDSLAAKSDSEQKQIIHLWVEQLYEQETEEKGDELLNEISLVILPMQIHRGAGTTSVHGAEKAEQRREAELYEPQHSFDDFNSGEYD